MKVFISGPMSGKPNDNRAAFYKAQEELEKKGYSVWNPAWLAYPSDTEFSKDAIHAIDNEALRHCDAIYMLKGWQYSEGARNEYKIAIARDLDIMYEEELWYRFRFNLSKVPEKNAPEFDKEFAYDEAVKNRTNYQLEAIKENVKEKYNALDRRIKSIEEELAWDKWKNDLPDNFCSNRIDSVEKQYKDLAEDVEDCKKEIDILFNHAFDGLEKRVDKEQYDDVNQAINDVKSDLDNFKNEVNRKIEKVCLYEIHSLGRRCDKDFDDVYDEFQSVKDTINDINFGYIDWSSKMSTAIEHIEETRKHVMSFYDGEFIDTFNKVDDRLKKLEKTVNGLNSIVGEIGNRLEKIENFVADTDVDYLEARVRGLEETFKTESTKNKKR